MSFEYQNNLSDLMEYLKQRLLGNQDGSQNVSFKNYSKRRLKYIKGKTGNSGPASGQIRRRAQIVSSKHIESPKKVLQTFYDFLNNLEQVCIISEKAYQNGSILLKEKLKFCLADSEGQEVLRGPDPTLTHQGHAKGRIGVALHTFRAP